MRNYSVAWKIINGEDMTLRNPNGKRLFKKPDHLIVWTTEGKP